MKFLTPILLILFLFSSDSLFAQFHIEYHKVLGDLAMDSSKIAQNGFKSAHVYTDNTEESYLGGNYLTTNKRAEFEFNEQGLLVYKRTIGFDQLSYALGDKKTVHETRAYSADKKMIQMCSLNDWGEFCSGVKYDQDGHIVELTNSGDGVQNSTYTFKWVEGKMVEFQNFGKENESFNVQRKFDLSGRITSISYDKGKQLINYDTINGAIRMIHEIYQDSKLKSKSIKLTDLKNSKMIYQLSLNGEGDTLSLITAEYDASGNLTQMRHEDYSGRKYFERAIPPASMKSDNSLALEKEEYYQPNVYNFHVENRYENELLVKRIIHQSNEHNNKERVTVERIIYETTPLITQSWPNKEEEEGYWDYDSDYDSEKMEEPVVMPKKNDER